MVSFNKKSGAKWSRKINEFYTPPWVGMKATVIHAIPLMMKLPLVAGLRPNLWWIDLKGVRFRARLGRIESTLNFSIRHIVGPNTVEQTDNEAKLIPT